MNEQHEMANLLTWELLERLANMTLNEAYHLGYNTGLAVGKEEHGEVENSEGSEEL